jgi:hypothetical protein
VAVNLDLLRQATEARDRLVELQRDVEKTRSDYHYLIRRLHAEGGTLREIAEALGLSHQRVHQIVEIPGGEEPSGQPFFPPMFGPPRRGRHGGKFRHFSERARQAVQFAEEEAATLKHHAVGTEHLLLGLLRVVDGTAARTLVSLGVTEETVRNEIATLGNSVTDTAGPIPFTAKAKEAFELALRSALALGQNHIGTEHLLLALGGLQDAAAAKVLHALGVKPEELRKKLAA